MTEEEAVKIVDFHAEYNPPVQHTVAWWRVARTLRQALAEAQQQRQVPQIRVFGDIGGGDIDLETGEGVRWRIEHPDDVVRAERDALRRKLNEAASLLDDLAVDSSGRVNWADVANVQRHLYALAVVESDPT